MAHLISTGLQNKKSILFGNMEEIYHFHNRWALHLDIDACSVCDLLLLTWLPAGSRDPQPLGCIWLGTSLSRKSQAHVVGAHDVFSDHLCGPLSCRLVPKVAG